MNSDIANGQTVKQRYHFRPSLQLIEIVSPLLHHLPALGEVLRVVVGGANLVAFGIAGAIGIDEKMQPAPIAQLLRFLTPFCVADCGVAQGHVGISPK